MDLRDVPTEELRAEIARRKAIEDEEHRRQMKARFPCPNCGADPVSIEQNAVREHRMSPDFPGGQYLPYESELGRTSGVDYETTVTCENGHVTSSIQTKWFEEPKVGPPILR